MCGRYNLKTPAEDIVEHLLVEEGPPEPLRPRYNIAPTQGVPAVRVRHGRRCLDVLRWGLIPFWAVDPAVGARMINARREGIATKPAFRTAFQKRRCLIPADGFYEWMKLEGTRRKQPYLVQRRGGGLLVLAGLWERWRAPAGELVDTCTVITTDANALVAPLHDRMPVILDPSTYALWLDPAVEDAERLEPLLRPFPAERMESFPVDPRVGDVRQDDPGLIVPVPPIRESVQRDLFG